MLRDDFRQIDSQVRAQIDEFKSKRSRVLAGNTMFIPDGRVYCGPRLYGDSRYPYGDKGTHLWATASGRFYGNRGLFFYFLPPVTGQDPCVSFVAGQRRSNSDSFEPFSLLPVPTLAGEESDRLSRYSVIGHDGVWYFTETPSIRGGVRFFLDSDSLGNTAMVWSIFVENKSDTPADLYVSSFFNPHFRHQFHETHEDRWFKKTYVAQNNKVDAKLVSDRHGHLRPFVIEVNEDQNRFGSVTHLGLLRRHAIICKSNDSEVVQSPEQQVATSLGAYVGSVNRNLSTASFLSTGRLSGQPELTVFHDTAIASDLQSFSLAPRAVARFDYELCHHQLLNDFEKSALEPISPWSIDHRLSRIRNAGRQKSDRISLSFEGSDQSTPINSDAFNQFIPYLRRQIEVCASTEGYMHASPNSLIGVRDVMQAVEAILIEDPMLARARILECIAHVLSDGRCPRQYSLAIDSDTTKADLREFVDQGVWVISTIYTYLATTGDLALLNENVGYHEIVDPIAGTIALSDESDTVLNHMERICGYLNRQREPETGLVRALYGDWNDALDGLGVRSDGAEGFGAGVSVMASLQFFQNCREMAEMYAALDASRFANEITEYQELKESIRDALDSHALVSEGGQSRIVHGWGDKREYYIGSFKDVDGAARDGLTSYAFWVLSGMRNETLRGISDEDILAAFSRLDSSYGLKTFEPGFRADARGVGRIRKLPIGTAENGATYVHATLFGVAAMFAINEPDRAWVQLAKVLPFLQNGENLSHSPFVMPNSYAHNVELGLDGQSMNDWQTGSSNVLLKVLARHVVGVQPTLTGLKISPANASPFGRISFRCNLQRMILRVSIAHCDVPTRTIRVRDGSGKQLQRELFANEVSFDNASLENCTELQVEVCDPLN
ncbi:MAG: hypothetical protein DHS20C16_28540 [Phycisphaerae bacterium]|nr:MAG: hypothetical protein DHS20C16_28540 [Phycisphaerae bacterium]